METNDRLLGLDLEPSLAQARDDREDYLRDDRDLLRVHHHKLKEEFEHLEL